MVKLEFCSPTYQWPFQELKLEVPTIYKAYFWGLNFREYPHKIWPEIWYIVQYLHLLDPFLFPLNLAIGSPTWIRQPTDQVAYHQDRGVAVSRQGFRARHGSGLIL